MSTVYTAGMPTDRRRRRVIVRVVILVLVLALMLVGVLVWLTGRDGAGEAPTACETAPPSNAVNVLNATGRAGLAAHTADALRAQRFTVGRVGNALGAQTSTPVEIRHGADGAQVAAALAARIAGARVVDDGRPGDDVDLLVGEGFDSLAAPTAPPC